MRQKPVKKLVQELFVRMLDEQLSAPSVTIIKAADAPKRKYRKRRKGVAGRAGARK